ncbi:MAG: 2OG-Fe(II) oxygenase family protein [Gammaproteobacteria bacterium]|nr:2OG-Fe(II) oxygenase family protein [Gammaproteobacteria bacterium]
MSMFKHPSLYSNLLDNADNVNARLLDGFYRHLQDEDNKRTHLFEGRYENIYISSEKIPEKSLILQAVIATASKILDISPSDLKAGLWFNAMQPGDSTTAHRHDDDDELLSAVYYVKVPKNSGELILTVNNFTTHVTPKEGMMVFFPPDMIHEVTENKSNEMRLSLGINIGPGSDTA